MEKVRSGQDRLKGFHAYQIWSHGKGNPSSLPLDFMLTDTQDGGRREVSLFFESLPVIGV